MQKSQRLSLVLTAAEKRVAIQLADKEGGLSIAALVRRLIREAAQVAGLWPPVDTGKLIEIEAVNVNRNNCR